MWVFAFSQSSADYADLRRFRQDGIRGGIVEQARLPRRSLGEGGSPASLGNRSGCPTTRSDPSRASHVRAGAGVDLDQFTFLDEKRHVDRLAGFELRRLGDITGGIAAQTFR